MQVDISVDINDALLKLQRAKKAPNNFVRRVLARMAADLKHEAPKNTSQLTNAIRHQITGEASGQVLIDTNYAGFVEAGRKPGGVDFAAIKDWVKQKGLGAGAAYPIARSIQKKGVKPNPFVSRYLESSGFDDMVDSIVADEVR